MLGAISDPFGGVCMSKIFDAYQKKVGETIDHGLEVAQAGSQRLFPTPSAKQQAEFDQLANRMLGLRHDSRGTVIGFASSESGEGSSYVSYTVANILSRIYNQKVAWLDLNILSPQKKLIDSTEISVAAYLQDSSLIEKVPNYDSLLLVPAGDNLMGKRGLFAGQGFLDLLAGLSFKFDFTILDLPPILSSADPALMASAADGLLLVLEQRHLKWEVIEHGVNSLQEKGVQVIGTVINHRKYDLPKFLYDRL